MTKNVTCDAIARERSKTELQLEAKRRVIRQINRAIADLNRERREAQLMVDYYLDAIARAGLPRRRLLLGRDYRALKMLAAQQLSSSAAAAIATVRRLVTHAHCSPIGRR